MQEQLFDGMDAMAANPQVRIIVVTGAGRAFCAGADMKGLDQISSVREGPPTTKNGFGMASPTPKIRSITHAMTIPKPVIAAINGPVAGMGLAFALTCDFRFAANDAKITCAFSKLGLIAEHGMSWTLPKLVGTGTAMQLLMSSDVILGVEAQRLGMVQRCFDKAGVLDETVKYARDLAATYYILHTTT